ncbi:MAG: TauD/TfdA family dioxygenase [Oligoflexia bacterium]|nr:TauD/TfdA family dioxygenase [Oligoflexia bacterium]
MSYQIETFKTHAEIFVDIKLATTETVKEIVSLVPRHITVILKKQHLTAETFVSLVKKAGFTNRHDYYFNDPDYPEISRVTNERDASGHRVGVFPSAELSWHSAGNNRKHPEQFIALYCVKKGLGGDTYFANGYLSYEDLPEKYKNLSHKVKVVIRCNKENMNLTAQEAEIFSGQFDKQRGKETYQTIVKPLVSYNPYTNKPALYFCHPYINNMYIEGDNNFDSLEFFSFLKKHMFQKKYIYHHKWEEGDLIFNDQSSGLHRRDAVNKEEIRFLYRVAFNLKN